MAKPARGYKTLRVTVDIDADIKRITSLISSGENIPMNKIVEEGFKEFNKKYPQYVRLIKKVNN